MINQGENLVVTGTPSLDYFINHKAKMKNNMLFMHRIGLLIIKHNCIFNIQRNRQVYAQLRKTKPSI